MVNQFIMMALFKWLPDSKSRCFAATAKSVFRRSFLLILFFLGWATTVQADIPASERAVLISLYASTHGASWTTNDGWKGDVGTECNSTSSWFGITCDDTYSHVIGIDLSDNNLVGTLPSLSGLTALQTFDVNNNQLTGSIPALSGLTALQYFDVNSNQLAGSIPAPSGLTALQTFDVDNNQLTGSIPALSGLTALQYFDANGNQLTGSTPALSGLTALQYFDVNGNQLTGSIPALSGLTTLQTFDVSGNQLTGSISSLSGLTALQDFWVGQNQLSGSIPALSGLTALQTFEVNDNQLTGSIPALSGLMALKYFWAGQNQLTGSIPALSGLTALQTFDVNGNNMLMGSIPALSGLTSLKFFSVQDSQLTGVIPALSGLTSLQQFMVSNNQLTGSIPDLSGLTALQTFSANGNQLTGLIPALSGLTSLQTFSVDGNKLTGPIPALSGLTSLQIFDVGGNQLTGKVPPAPASLSTGWGQLCGNSLVSSGDPSTDAAWGNWLACQTTGSGGGATIALSAGWNLVGNGVEAPITVANTFNDATKVTTIWKWVTAGSAAGITYPAWAFYTPTQSDGGKAYAASKGYEFLTTINAGEGFWVSAKTAFSAPLPSAAAVQSSSFMPAVAATAGGSHALPHGWSLIATGNSVSPAQFDAAIATALSIQPTSGQVYANLTSLWAWDATHASWYFWAPSLVNSNGLASYIQSKNFLDFTTMPTTPTGTLSQTTGFWVNMP